MNEKVQDRPADNSSPVKVEAKSSTSTAAKLNSKASRNAPRPMIAAATILTVSAVGYLAAGQHGHTSPRPARVVAGAPAGDLGADGAAEVPSLGQQRLSLTVPGSGGSSVRATSGPTPGTPIGSHGPSGSQGQIGSPMQGGSQGSTGKQSPGGSQRPSGSRHPGAAGSPGAPTAPTGSSAPGTSPTSASPAGASQATSLVGTLMTPVNAVTGMVGASVPLVTRLLNN